MPRLPADWYKRSTLRETEIERCGSIRAAARENNVSEAVIRKYRSIPDAPDISSEELLREELKDVKRALDACRQGAIFDERAVRLLERELGKIRPTYTTPKVAPDQGFTPHEFLLQWSDLHGCEKVSLEQTNGLNRYDFETMVARHWRMRHAILSFKRHRPYPVSRLTIVPGGDMVSGDIHDELRETNERVLMEAAIDIGNFGAEWIASLAPEFPEIVVDGMVVGNHGRRTRKPQAKNQHDNFDYLVYEILRIRLAGLPNVKVVCGEDGKIKRARHQFIQVAGKQIMVWHGDGVRSTMVGVPWGGITRRCNELQKQYEQRGKIDHFLIHHWHEPHLVQNRRILVNGSVKGPDEFGISMGMAAPSCQLLHTFHPRRGLTDVSFLDLQESY